MSKIIKLTESQIRMVMNEGYDGPKEKILKKVNLGGIDIWAKINEGDDCMWVCWNYENGRKSQQCSEWLRHVKGNLYSTMTQWDELDYVLKALGVKKVSEKSNISDWGDGDTDKFTRTVYDFSSVFSSENII